MFIDSQNDRIGEVFGLYPQNRGIQSGVRVPLDFKKIPTIVSLTSARGVGEELILYPLAMIFGRECGSFGIVSEPHLLMGLKYHGHYRLWRTCYVFDPEYGGFVKNRLGLSLTPPF